MTDLSDEQMLEFRKDAQRVWPDGPAKAVWRHFANLVAAHEREACAQSCDEFYEQISELPNSSVARECAALIRERRKGE